MSNGIRISNPLVFPGPERLELDGVELLKVISTLFNTFVTITPVSNINYY